MDKCDQYDFGDGRKRALLKKAQQAEMMRQELAAAESDPHGTNAHTPGAKLDAGKVDLTFLEDWPHALAAVCRVAEFGANKYSRGGWLKVPDGFRRYTKAMLRHVLRIGDLDVILGVAPEHIHDAQVAWNALSRLEMKLRGEQK
jgi:Domain of unknown function (DUF5664)